MTASEKLRELNDLNTYSGGVIQRSDQSAIRGRRLLDALPEIIAVVAAAERLASYNEIHTWKRDGETTAMPELAEPLAALDAALNAN